MILKMQSGALGPFSDNDSEILCLFLFPKLHTNELPLFRRIQTAKASVEVFVQHATSSVVAPYTTRAYSIKKMLDDDDTVVLSINDVGVRVLPKCSYAHQTQLLLQGVFGK